MRQISVVTVGRSDYGIYRPLLNLLDTDASIDLSLYVSGMHLSPTHGWTSSLVEADGYRIADKIDMLMSSDEPVGIAKSMANAISGFAQSFSRWRPDILVVLGDRFEMISAAIAAQPFRIPIAHIHGGELTTGAIDDVFRHSLTKMSHLHFASTESYGKRIVQLGEAPWRVTVSGAPSLDNLASIQLLSKEEMEQKYGLNLSEPCILFTFHPVTNSDEETPEKFCAVLDALDETSMPVVFTQPNADAKGSVIASMINAYLLSHPEATMVENFGVQGYFSMMSHVAAMVGNSSSGLIEAPSFGLPVVNIGSRQGGRTRGMNVIDVGYDSKELRSAIEKAISPSFRKEVGDAQNPYGDGRASEKILTVLRDVTLGDALISKVFHDLP